MEDGKAVTEKNELTGLSEALDNTGICTFMYFPETRSITVPEKARKMYGCGEVYENMPYSFAEDFVFADDRPGFNEMYFKIDAGAETATAVFHNLEQTARCHVTLTVASSDASGQAQEVLGIIENETAEMNQTRELGRLIQALSSDCFAVLEINFRCDRIKLKRRLGGALTVITDFLDQSDSYQNFVTYNLEYFVTEEDRKRYQKMFAADYVMRQLQEHKSLTVRYKRQLNSQVNDLEARFVDISEKNDGSSAVLAYRYIDDIVRTEEKEHRQDAVFRSLGNIFYTIYYVDVIANTYQEITAENVIQTWFEPKGAVDENLKKLCANLVAPEFREHMLAFTDMKTLNERMRGKKTISTEYIGVIAHWIQATFVANERDKGGNLLKVLYVTRKINEEKEKELSYQQNLKNAAREAEEANQAKTDFLSRMSHDIRTPLNGIIGMTYLAQQENNPDRTTDCLKKIDTSSKFLLGLVNDVLDMAKAESGRLELHPEPYSAETFYDYFQSVIRPLCEEKNIHFKIDDNTAKDVDVLVDPLRISQVFFNLLSNAVKFTPEGGEVTFRIRHERIGNDRMRITSQVIDTGIGMSEAFQKVIFEPFTQENRTDSAENRGSGLGLAIVKRIVDAMGGTITVESRINHGTTFTVITEAGFVPAKHLQGPKEETGKENAGSEEKNYESLAGKHVLLCEDHPLNQEIATVLLQDRKMLVEVAEDGRIGAEMFRRSPEAYYDVILMDIRMPVMNGYEAAQTIRSFDREDAKRVPIIAMTADAFADDIRKCLAAGMNGHISKPVDPLQLYRVLEDEIRGEKQ